MPTSGERDGLVDPRLRAAVEPAVTRRARDADRALDVVDRPDLRRVAACVRGRLLDEGDLGRQLVGRDVPARRDPADGAPSDEAEHPRTDRSDPDPDVVYGARAGMHAREGVEAAV